MCLPYFIDSLLSQGLGGGVNVERIITRESLLPRRRVPIYQIVVSAAAVDPIRMVQFDIPFSVRLSWFVPLGKSMAAATLLANENRLIPALMA